MVNPFRDLLWTLRCLTRIPLGCGGRGPASPFMLAVWFPLVGAGIGFVCGVVVAVTSGASYPLVAVGLGLLVNALLTGALHMDGLADTADGVYGGWTRERRLEIMRDSNVGSYGVIAIVLALLLKFSALEQTATGASVIIFWTVAVMLSRYAMVISACLSPYARQGEGAGKHFIDLLKPAHVIPATVAALAVIYLAARFPIAPADPLKCAIFIIPALVAAVALTVYLRWKIGGATGDTIGAVGECVETITLILLVSPVAPVWPF